MPIHMHPALRVREEIREQAGNLMPVDSKEVTRCKTLEDSGRLLRQYPVVTIRYLGKVYRVWQTLGENSMIDFTPQTTILYGMSSLVMRRCTYFRIGDWLQVIGSFDFVPETDQSDMAFSMTPPLAHVFDPLTDDMIPIARTADLPRVRFNLTIDPNQVPANDRITATFSNAPTTIAAGTASFMYWVRIPE